MGLFKGCLYCFLWFTSILAGYAGLFCPLLPLLLISNKLYRWCTDALFTFWQYYPTILLEKLCGCDIQVTGDPILTSETSILVMNHRTRTDWTFLWPTLYHCTKGNWRFKHSTKFVLKDVVKYMPGPGWVMQLSCFLFIKRCWLLDKPILQKILGYFSQLSYKFSLLVFPEGTDFTPSTKRKSDLYAEDHHLEKYNYVLHPHTTGFVFLAKDLMDKGILDAIYDITLVYPDIVPQNEKVLLKGHFPSLVKVHLTRYPCNILPRTEDGLKEFLEKRWLDKEKILREFHVTNHFLHGGILKQDNANGELYLALIFWSLLPFVVFYCFLTLSWFRYLILGHTVLLVFINFAFDGFASFEIWLFYLKRSLFFNFGAKN